MIKTVFFDINDTLINHSIAQENAIRNMFTLLPEHDEAEFISIWKDTARKYWELLEKDGITFEQQRIERIESVWNHFKIKLTPKQANQYADCYVTYYKQALSINPAFKTFLEFLRANYISVGIISNGYGPLQRSRLKVAGVESYLTESLIFISDEIGIAKPDKKIFRFILKKHRIKSDECIFIDDNDKNIISAKELGFNTIHYTATIKDFNKELEILKVSL